MSEPLSRRLFDICSAVEYLRGIGASGVTVTCVRRMISSGELPHVRLGKKFYISQGAIEAWLVKSEKRNRA
jgi:excisionase family DNA binding protein